MMKDAAYLHLIHAMKNCRVSANSTYGQVTLQDKCDITHAGSSKIDKMKQAHSPLSLCKNNNMR